ncbi:MAG: translation elongation factor Ts [Bdellovibrionota bacterium]
MADITAGSVNELRKKTGAGMMDCKKALTETEGDIEKAVDFLRKKGLAAAAKKAGRIAAEGLVTALVANGGKTAVVAEVNSETDFVAKTDDFMGFVSDVALHVIAENPADLDTLHGQGFTKNKATPVKDVVTALIAKIGENIQIRRFSRFDVQGHGAVGAYIHAGGQIGVIVEIGCEKAENAAKPELAALAKDICLHVAANKPLYLASSEVSKDVLDREVEIAKDQARLAGKKEEFIGKIAEGKVAKYYEEFCLLEQGFVKDPSVKIKKVVEDASKTFGDKLSVRRFARFELGEGIEKKTQDFAAEVAATMGGA